MKLKFFWIGLTEKELRYSVDGGKTWLAVPTADMADLLRSPPPIASVVQIRRKRASKPVEESKPRRKVK